jgi:hypothetical protein
MGRSGATFKGNGSLLIKAQQGQPLFERQPKEEGVADETVTRELSQSFRKWLFTQLVKQSLVGVGDGLPRVVGLRTLARELTILSH